MKIYSSKVDDIIKQRDEYEAKMKALKDKQDESYRNYHKADVAICNGIEDEVAQLLSRIDLPLQIKADQGWSSADRKRGYDVRVSCETGADRDLRWEYNVKFEQDGAITKNDGRWNDLDSANLDELDKSIKALRILQGADWKSILDKAHPKFDDYYDRGVNDELLTLRSEKPNFKDMEFEATLEDATDEGKWIVLDRIPETDYLRGRKAKAYFKPERIGAKFINGILRDFSWVHEGYDYDIKISKTKLQNCMKHPYEIVDLADKKEE